VSYIKKILYIVPNKINEMSGGGIGAKQIFKGLRNTSNNKDYNLQVISLDDNLKNKLEIDLNKSVFKDIFSRCLLHSNYLYIDWFKIKEKIIQYNPDIVVFSSSRLGAMAKKIKKINKDIYVLCFFGNIEFDYVDSYSLKYDSALIRNAFSYIEKFVVKKDEEDMINYMDSGIFLTNRDVKRVRKIYTNDIMYNILPICIENSDVELKNKNDYKLNLIFLGSLWYGSNVNGIKWFLNNVWQKILNINSDINFIIGGSDPSNNFLNYLEQFRNVEVHPNFKSKEDIIPENSLFISPIQTGAGMKVKVADALSLGLPIIASKESLIGYEESLNDDLNREIINLAQSPDDYVKYIKKYLKENNILSKRGNAKKIFKKYYSLKRASRQIQQILDKI